MYTALEVRGRGFGAAVTVEACRRALGAGAERVVLFADLDNRRVTASIGAAGFHAGG